jgi:hypothetical protein
MLSSLSMSVRSFWAQTDIGICSADQALQCSNASSSSIMQGNVLVPKGIMLPQARSFCQCCHTVLLVHLALISSVERNRKLKTALEFYNCAHISPHPFGFIFLYKSILNMHFLQTKTNSFCLSYDKGTQWNCVMLRNINYVFNNDN